MRTKSENIDVLLIEKLKMFDTDINQAIKNLLLMLRNEAKSEEAKFILSSSGKQLAENQAKLETLMQDVESEFENALVVVKSRLTEMKMNLIKTDLQIKYPRMITPTYEFEESLEYQKIFFEGLKANRETLLNQISMFQKSIDDTQAHRLSEYSKRKEVLEEQNRRLELDLKRALVMKDAFKFFRGLDGTKD